MDCCRANSSFLCAWSVSSSRNRPDGEHRPNATAVGNPEDTRAAIYANADSTKLVTVTVDRYATVGDAAAAYREALDKSEAVPGFGPISIRLNVGQQSFAGTVTMGGETHVGLGALDSRLIVGATLAGFDATPDALHQPRCVSVRRRRRGQLGGWALGLKPIIQDGPTVITTLSGYSGAIAGKLRPKGGLSSRFRCPIQVH